MNDGPEDFGGEDYPRFGSIEWNRSVIDALEKQYDEMEERLFMASRENSVKVYPCSNPFCTENHDRTSKPMQDFATGATRSGDEDKIDFEGHLHPDVLYYFGQYMHKHRVQRDGKTRASDNWQEGIPIHKYLKSLLRHSFDLWRAWRGTVTINPDSGEVQTLGELACAILFNVQGLLLELMRSGLAGRSYVEKALRKQIETGNPVSMPPPAKQESTVNRKWEAEQAEQNDDETVYLEQLGRERY